MIAFMPTARVNKTLLILVLFISRAFSLGIEFDTPAGGSTWPAGPLTVQWSNAGGSPDQSDLVSYNLVLVVGGNTQDNSEVIQSIGKPNASPQDGTVQDEIMSDIAQSIQNGFYLKMTSNTSTGDQVINYSNRFTLINMNGTTDAAYLEGANAAAGDSSDVPASQYNVISPSAPIPSVSASSPTSSQTDPANESTSATPQPAPNGHGHVMSKAQIAGLATGGVLALIGLASLFIWAVFFWRRIKRKQEEKRDAREATDEIVQHHGAPAFLGHKAELPAHGASSSQNGSPFGPNPQTERFEMNGLNKLAEAPASRESVYELEGEWSGWEASSGRKSRIRTWDPTL